MAYTSGYHLNEELILEWLAGQQVLKLPVMLGVGDDTLRLD